MKRLEVAYCECGNKKEIGKHGCADCLTIEKKIAGERRIFGMTISEKTWKPKEKSIEWITRYGK